MAASHQYLLFDQNEIVQEPFRRRGDAPPSIGREGGPIVSAKGLLIFTQTGEQPIGGILNGDLLATGQQGGVPLKLVRTEQFRPEGKFLRTSRALGSPSKPLHDWNC